MASATTARSNTPSSRRPAISPATPPPGNLARTSVSARSAVSPRVAGGPLSSHIKRASRGSIPLNSDKEVANAPREALEALLKREQDEKELLLLKTQNHEQTIENSTKEVDTLTSHLKAAESRLAELDADQERMEKEAAEKEQVIDLLRSQIKELEREKREVRKRYEDQTSTFEAERQAFYSEQQHLKSRIQALSQTRRRSPRRPRSPSVARDDASVTQVDEDEPEEENPLEDEKADEENEPAEMTALRLELSTLSVSHASLQNTLQLLQTQLLDLQVVNSSLQEDNESYALLLQEKTLSGQFDIRGVTNDDDSINDDEEGRTPRGRYALDVVPEADESQAAVVNKVLSSVDRDSSPASRRSDRSTARSRRGVPRAGSPPRGGGESLGDLPITGPGLDLAAELGRAENKDISEGKIDPKPQPQIRNEPDDLKALRTEVRALKDANKALSLYASKIIDRIIAQEGFEHVLAVDYEAPGEGSKSKAKAVAPSPPRKPRPQSSFFPSRSATLPPSSSPAPALSRTSSDSAAAPTVASAAMASTASAPAAANSSAAVESASDKRARRGMSMDWKGISSFFGGSTPAPVEVKNDKLRPLTLKASAPMTNTPPPTARRVETVEDEEDRRERERLAATMKLMGIEKPVEQTSTSDSQNAVTSPPMSSRVPFFTRFRSSDSAPPTPSPMSTPPQHLTTEALEQAEIESSLAALEAKEKALSEQYAKGRGSGFTELGNSPRSSLVKKHRSAKSGSGKGTRLSDDNSDGHSVNTIFSAGTMSGDVPDEIVKA